MKKLLFLLLFLSLTFTSYAAETQGQNILTGEDYKEDVVSLNEELRKLHKGIKKITDTDTDIKAKVSSNDTTAGYLNGKLVAGTGITLTENTDGGNETLGISISGTTYGHKQLFTADGTFTAPAGVTTVFLTMVGGGGGGQKAVAGAGGGSGGGFVKKPYTTVPTNNYTVTIGAAGTAGTVAAGGDGGNTVFDTLTVYGGAGGAGGVGGISGATAIEKTRPATGVGVNGLNTGCGGSGIMGVGGLDVLNDVGGNGSGYGAGGAGGENSNNGGAGTAGAVLVEW
jgi:hypothetical protein